MDISERLARLTPEQRRQLEARLGQRNGAHRGASDTIPARGPGDALPLSFAQERLWFLEQLEGASATYNICFAHRLVGPLRVDALEHALTELVQRHDVLRTKFASAAGNHAPVQQISDAAPFHLQIIDLAHVPQPQQESSVARQVEKIARTTISLGDGPLFSVHLLRLSSTEHVMVLLVHHMISDGWSFDVLFREISVLYADLVSHRAPSLPALQIQYSDYARWQRNVLQGARLSLHLDYWKKRLDGIPPLLELPLDHVRPAEQSYRGSWCERRISHELTQKISALTRETESTVFMLVLAAFQVLLYRYSGQTDVVVGTPATSRNRIELEPLIGFFVNMLPLRADLSGSLTVRQLIRQVRSTTLEAIAHQELPFEMLVRELRPERKLSHAPIFQVALMFQQEDHQSLQLPDLTVTPVTINTGTSKFDLTLFASETSNGLRFWLEYSTDLFAAATAERFLRNFEVLLESITSHPDELISQLNLLSPAERMQILETWNQTTVDYPRSKTIHQLFEEQAARTPTAVALECDRARITYRELSERSSALAIDLNAAGISIETNVGIFVERSIDMVVAVMGVLQAGGTYVPLDPSFPKDRLAMMVADANCRVIVTQSRLLEELPPHNSHILCVDAARSGATGVRKVQSSSENLAYILFTSGSTGRPKGVQISHRAVVNFLESMRREPGLAPTDVLLAVTTLSFDIAGLELFLPLTTGAKIVIALREDCVDGVRLSNLMHDASVTVMQATPATWRMLIDAGWKGDRRLKALCGGEAIDRDLADQLITRCAELWNMYGPTETTIWSTTERVKKNTVITIGRPIANTQIYILDSNSQPTPAGVIGELFIGGDGVARGYLDRADLNREKFLPNPFKRSSDERIYRTGDLSRYRSDGRIEFLGRIDHQVKIRGFRIETGEIEHALSAEADVAQAVVVVREDEPGNKKLVAYNVMKEATDDSAAGATIAKLRTNLRAKLPDYMIPAAFVFLEAFPLTPNGKVDRKALPRPEFPNTDDVVPDPPVGETEVKLAAMMAKLLRIPKVSRTDDFFALGGYSILAVSLFNEIEREFNKRLPLATLFRAPTVAGLAAMLDVPIKPTKKWDSLVEIQQGGDRPRFFCVHGAGGNVLLYRDLVRAMGPDYPFYGLQSQGLDRQAAPLTTVGEMAELYLREIQALQPNGPYCLGGYCLGGTIAFEMAQRLRRQGHEVPVVALFDTYNFTRANEEKPLLYLWQKVVFHARNLSSLPPKDLPGYLSSKARVASDGELRSLFRGLTKSLRRNRSKPASISAEAVVQEVNDAAALAYQPEIYSGRLTVFKPKINYDFLPDPKMGWGQVVPDGLEIVELPVNPHAMLVTPFVKLLATSLRTKLDAVLSPRRS